MKDRRFAIVAFAVFMALFAGIYLFTQRDASTNNASDNSNGSTRSGTTNTSGTISSNSEDPSIVQANAGITVPPQFKNQPSEWNAAFGNIIAFQNQLLQKPDPSKVIQIMDPTCTCYEETKSALQDMKDKGQHVNGKTMELRAAALVRQNGDSYAIAATFVGGGGPTVDRNGKTITPGNTDQSLPIRYTLKKKSNGAWVITERRPLQEAKK